MAKNVIGCEKNFEMKDRNCPECDCLKDCLRFHEECIHCICLFIADLIESGGYIAATEMTRQIKKAADEAFFGKKEDKKESKEDYNLYA